MDNNELLNNEIDHIINVHEQLHGKNIVDYAIVDDIMRKTKYAYAKPTIFGIVKSKLNDLN